MEAGLTFAELCDCIDDRAFYSPSVHKPESNNKQSSILRTSAERDCCILGLSMGCNVGIGLPLFRHEQDVLLLLVLCVVSQFPASFEYQSDPLQDS